MFQIASEISEQPLKRNLSAAFVKILEKKTDATPEILDQLKQLATGADDTQPEDSKAAAPPTVMRDPTSPSGFIELIWQKVKDDKIVEATQVAQILEKRIKQGTTIL